MAKISQKCTFWVKKIFFRPKIKPYESYFCKHPPEVRFGRFLGLWDHFSKSLSVFRFFHLFKNRHFLAQIGMYQGYGKHFSQISQNTTIGAHVDQIWALRQLLSLIHVCLKFLGRMLFFSNSPYLSRLNFGKLRKNEIAVISSKMTFFYIP